MPDNRSKIFVLLQCTGKGDARNSKTEFNRSSLDTRNQTKKEVKLFAESMERKVESEVNNAELATEFGAIVDSPKYASEKLAIQ